MKTFIGSLLSYQYGLSSNLAKLQQENPLILPDVTPVNINELLEQINAYILFNEYIEKLGWIEHTSDWDPSVTVILKDGTKYENVPGYSAFEPINYGDTELSLPTCQNWDTEDFNEDVIIKIPIKDIKQISYYYH